jgi:RNA polymerase sigma-70 factor (ECF subfamily)
MQQPGIEVTRVMSQVGGPSAAARAELFDRLVDRRALDRAYRYATLVTGSRSDAEDATHDAALTAWRHFGDLRDPARFEAWFGRILVNACRDRIRARRRIVRSLDDDAPDGRRAGSPASLVAADRVESIAVQDSLATALRELSPDHREVVVLRFYLDLTIDQIAARTGTRPGTVKSRLHHALHRLRASIDPTAEGRIDR